MRGFGFAAITSGMPVAERRREVRRRNPHLEELPRLERRRALFPQTFAAVAGSRMLSDLIGIVDEIRPDVIVHEAAELAAPAVAAARDIPSVCIGFGGVVAPEMLEDDPVRELWGSAGVSFRECAGQYDWLYLHPMPPSLQALPRNLPNAHPVKPVGADGGEADSSPPWVDSLGRDRPLIYSTFGTEFAMLAPLTTVRDAVGQLDADVVLTTGATVEPESLEPLPQNVRVERYVPQRFLLSRASAVLSQAGSGITLAACSRGLPQVCMPLTADQFDNASMVAKAGAGLTIDSTAGADEIAAVVQKALDESSILTAAGGVADEIAAMPSPERYVPMIETLAP